MPGFSAEVPHQLDRAEARTRVANFLSQLTAQYGDQIGQIESHWQDHALVFAVTTFGQKVSGRVEVLEATVSLDGQLPLTALLFRDMITESFRDAMAKALA